MASAELIHLGMDTSMNTIVVGVLRSGEEMPVVDQVFNEEESIRRLIGRRLRSSNPGDTAHRTGIPTRLVHRCCHRQLAHGSAKNPALLLSRQPSRLA